MLHHRCSPGSVTTGHAGSVPACRLNCTAHELRPRPLAGRHRARPRLSHRAPPLAAVRARGGGAANLHRERLSSMSDPVLVRSIACLNSMCPSLMSGCLPSLSVLRFSAHPCNPGTHTETPWRSADALCWLSARRLLHGSRAEGWHDGCRAPHGAAWAPERRRGARRRSVLPGPRY